MFTALTIVKLIIFIIIRSSWCYKCFEAFFFNNIISFIYNICVCNSKVSLSLSLSLSLSIALLYTMYVLEHRDRFYAIHILYICTYTIYIIAWKSENRSLERFETSVSGGAVRRRIVDTFALFDYSKAAEALSIGRSGGSSRA